MYVKACSAALVAAGCSWLWAASPALAGEPAPSEPKWEAWTELGGYAANRSSARRGELTLWAPLLQDPRSIFFADLRGKLFDDDQYEGNTALGYRYLGSYGWNPGFWVGFDRRHTEAGSDLDQISFGVEALSSTWDVRINGYVPLETRELVSTTTSGSAAPTVEVIGGGIFLVPGALTSTDLYELAFWGLDGEIGYRVPLERLWGETAGVDGGSVSGRHHDLRLFVGGFYFDHEDFDGEIAGPRVRAEWRIENAIENWEGSRLTFETGWQHDDVRDHQFEGGVRLRIPLGGGSSAHASLSPQEKRMTEGLKRDTDIVAQVHTETRSAGGSTAPEAVEDAVTGVDLTQVVTVENGADLGTAITAAGSNTLIIARGGAANFGSITMANSQTLLGGGGTLQVRGLTSGATATYTAQGTTPTLQANSGTIITGAEDNHIAGVIVDGTGAAAFGARFLSSGSTAITNSTIRNVVSYGVQFASTNGTFRLQDSTISDSGSGLYLGIDNVTAVIQNNTFMNMTNYAMDIHDHGGVTTVTIRNNTFNGSYGAALVNFFDGDAVVTADSTGNVDGSSPAADLCTFGGTAFTGSFSFTNGSTVNQAGC